MLRLPALVAEVLKEIFDEGLHESFNVADGANLPPESPSARDPATGHKLSDNAAKFSRTKPARRTKDFEADSGVKCWLRADSASAD